MEKLFGASILIIEESNVLQRVWVINCKITKKIIKYGKNLTILQEICEH